MLISYPRQPDEDYSKMMDPEAVHLTVIDAGSHCHPGRWVSVSSCGAQDRSEEFSWGGGRVQVTCRVTGWSSSPCRGRVIGEESSMDGTREDSMDKPSILGEQSSMNAVYTFFGY